MIITMILRPFLYEFLFSKKLDAIAGLEDPDSFNISTLMLNNGIPLSERESKITPKYLPHELTTLDKYTKLVEPVSLKKRCE